VDLELRMGTDKYLVQCKQWKTTRVGVATVRELYGVMAAERAVGGFVVASGDFTRDARNFAEGRSIVLVDARKLNAMIVPARPPSAPQPVSTLPPAPREPTLSPVCPKCGGAMVQRTARQGVHAGKPFWGCVHYPACMGVRFK
jgi:restriction system protein